MTFQLAPEALDQGYRLEGHHTVGSTNALALERATNGDAGNLWICALKQESGRGRRGRAWETPVGNLAATLLVVGSHDPKRAATLGFVAGLSLSDALQAALPDADLSVAADAGGMRDGSRFALKWPNDVLADGAKLSGILLESTFLPDGRFAVAVGIGVNVVAHPADLPYPATSLQALGADLTAEDLLSLLSAAWARNIALWDEGRGLAVIRDLWLARAAGLGGDVAVRLDGAVLRGTFETIDEDCRFVIRLNDGSLAQIAAGDVHFGAVASASAS
ncbi:biotin--[acetyl-CoA-carboxylase] ligase [Tianweitania sp. BSSL-BM11]|uniref:biotin--[biotin carboxyl-carrier protein] ligase n=1 Tax=Tianweitania aestuarii TaxID=2814886 RepID=A0ABS5RT92_9HYPH|nr:biotin--[acetyl-CoA-carboxylase] ligase [Tianweitania aestuarii]MBS9720278.1 biotin--[acetyl-CoA-carboxylase] ligase [Tianweitania aestuarii]